MSKLDKRILLVLAVLLMLVIIPSSFAADAEKDKTRWNCILSIENYIDDSSTLLRKSIELYASTDVYDGWYAGVSAQLQKRNSSGTSWSNVSGKYYEVYDEDTEAHIYKSAIKVNAGTYRFKLVHTAYTTSGVAVETVTAYTDTITIY